MWMMIRMKTNCVPILHTMIKEYIKSEMKKGTYEEIHYQPMTFIPYENFAYDEDEMSEEED